MSQSGSTSESIFKPSDICDDCRDTQAQYADLISDTYKQSNLEEQIKREAEELIANKGEQEKVEEKTGGESNDTQKLRTDLQQARKEWNQSFVNTESFDNNF